MLLANPSAYIFSRGWLDGGLDGAQLVLVWSGDSRCRLAGAYFMEGGRCAQSFV